MTRAKDALSNHFLAVIVGQGFIWASFLLSTKRTWTVQFAVIAAGSLVVVLFLTYLTVWRAINERLSLVALGSSAAIVLSSVLFNASLFYYSTGTRANWNMRLSHLDAFFVAVGTLTTGGASGIIPLSETARSIMLCQMVADFVVVTFVIGAMVQRLSARTPKTSAND